MHSWLQDMINLVSIIKLVPSGVKRIDVLLLTMCKVLLERTFSVGNIGRHHSAKKSVTFLSGEPDINM